MLNKLVSAQSQITQPTYHNGEVPKGWMKPSDSLPQTYDVNAHFHDWSELYPSTKQQEWRTEFLVHVFVALIIMPLNQHPRTTEALWWVNKLKGAMWFRS